jgi:thiamine biosynthesis lipoprotein ApbE
MSRDSFHAMGMTVVVGGGNWAQRIAVRELFAEWDAVFSRFNTHSELNRVNRASAEHVVVSPLFAHVVREALAAAAATDGLVDPTLGVAIEAFGYDRDFAELRDDPRPPAPTAAGSWRTLRLGAGLLWRPRGVKLDLNGVVKALAVDESLRLLGSDGFVSAGGDVAANGAVVVGLPGGDSVTLLAGGIATSGSTARRWLRGGVQQHHLFDPATGSPARSRWDEVTVVASDCVTADVAAKAAYLRSAEGPAWLDARGLAGRFVRDGEVLMNARWRRAVAPERPVAA